MIQELNRGILKNFKVESEDFLGRDTKTHSNPYSKKSYDSYLKSERTGIRNQKLTIRWYRII